MMFCFGQGLKSGARPALVASAGISLGLMVHVLLAGLGLGALVNSMPWLFDVIRWMGVAYLLYLAWGAIRNGAVSTEGPARPTRMAFRDGMVVNLTNPKVILFVLAFIPQFIDPARPGLTQFMILGLAISLGGLMINGLAGQLAGGIGRRFAGKGGFARWLNRISAGIFALLALRLAVMEMK
jgi:threonine/homoserine/homoserine lactone efflux protein